ncbi:MAG: hypothetical protein ACRDI2_02535, partial [Chloroflexota bacterium]
MATGTTMPELRMPLQHATGPSPAFPFAWPDAAAPKLHWTQRAPDGRRHEAMPPLELDVRARWARSLWNAAEIAGRKAGLQVLELNGYQYWATASLPFTESVRMLRQQTFERPADALYEWGENYWDAVLFPEVDAGNRRLDAVNVDTLDATALAAHLEDALAWYERAWTLHWCQRPTRNHPVERFLALYKDVTGDEQADADRRLLAHLPNKMTEAVDGLIALARLVQGRPSLRALFTGRAPAEVLHELDRTDAGPEFRRHFDAFLEVHGLRGGASWGVERNHCLPGWRDQPALVIDLVQKYVPQDLDALAAAQTTAVEQRGREEVAARRSIADPEQRRRFDFWLAAARRQTQASENHNFYIDSAATSLLHRAISACARRLAAAGALAAPDDVWWLRVHEITAALRGLDAPE